MVVDILLEATSLSHLFAHKELISLDFIREYLHVKKHPFGIENKVSSSKENEVQFTFHYGTGKSGAARVGYVYLQEYGTILLVIAYSKLERDDLMPSEKKTIRSLIQRVEREFASGLIK